MNPLDELAALHARVDEAAAKLAATHADRLACKRGCFGCCVDGVTVFAIEAELIRQALPVGDAHPPGRCAFLDEHGACRVYAVRPYVCRTQGLPLRWIDEEQQAELRDVCELNDGEPGIETLESEDCWTIGPFERELADLQMKSSGHLRRVALREILTPMPEA